MDRQDFNKRQTGLAGAAVATLLAACGGGVGEAVIAVASFLGSGGGQYALEPRPMPAGYVFDINGAADSLTLSLSPTDVQTGQPADLYASRYPVYVLNRTGTRLLGCTPGTAGEVDGRRVVLGANGSCFSGNYDNINRIVSDDGSRALIVNTFPNLGPGLWVDVNDASRSLKFTSASAGCEFNGSTARRFTVALRPLSATQAAPGLAVALTPLGIASLAVAGGPTYSGEFIGISALRLSTSNPAASSDFQRRNLAPPAASC